MVFAMDSDTGYPTMGGIPGTDAYAVESHLG